MTPTGTDLRLYLDASALVKLVICEEHSEALRERMGSSSLFVSELAIAEVPRVVARRASSQVPRRTLDQGLLALFPALNLVDLTRRTLVAAAGLGDPYVRALDAIHIASAMRMGSRLDAFISYDRRQLGAARGAGLPIASPR